MKRRRSTHINLTIPAGKQTAIVGMSGGGKTLFVKMLLGFYPPAKGEITLGGIRLNNTIYTPMEKKM